jgi:hypothetical protein
MGFIGVSAFGYAFSQIANPASFLGALIAALGCAGFIWWLLRDQRERAAVFQRDSAAWLNAIAKWEQLYYCNRCGNVFDPGDPTHTFVPASRMGEYLLW